MTKKELFSQYLWDEVPRETTIVKLQEITSHVMSLIDMGMDTYDLKDECDRIISEITPAKTFNEAPF